MLIRTKPIQLHTGMGLSCGAESFSERIRGNYDLCASALAPKDLLFLMSEPPEEASSPAGMTVLVDQSGQQDHWNVTMDVVNHVVNRILLDGSARFTYQDQVYITTVLSRLGIVDTERFMDQVRQLRAESESTAHLLALYERELSRIREARENGTPLPALPAPPEAGQVPPAPAPDVELSLTILRRLDAPESIRRLYDLRRSWFFPVNHFQQGALQLSEQLRLSSSVSLEEHKRQLFQAPRLSLLYRLNRYEAEAAPEGGGEAALSQAAAAVLSGAVDNVCVQLLHRPELWQNQWLRMEQALWQSGTNALARYTLYHQAPPPAAPAALSRTEETVWNRYAGEVRAFQALRQYLVPRAERTPYPPPLPGAADTALLPLFPPGPDTLPPDARPLPGTSTLQQREALRERDSLERDHVRTERIPEAERRALSSPGTAAPPLELRHTERSETEELRERTVETRAQTAVRDHLERTLQEQRLWPPAVSAEERTRRLERELLRQSLHTAETARRETLYRDPLPPRERETWAAPRPEQRVPGDIPPLTLTARQAEELAPELLEEAVRRIDERNRGLRRALPLQDRRSAPAPLPTPDLRRTLHDSLRALTEPETLLKEIVERRQAEESAPLALTHREELLLRQLPAEERRIYEAVLAYEKDPERALSQGILRPGSLGELHGAIRQAERPPADRIHPEPEEAGALTRLTERVDTILEQLPGKARRGAGETEALTPPPALKLLHKAPPEEAGEEARTERHQTRTTVRTEAHREEVRRREERQVDIARQERTLVSETAEDITDLVNRTLAGQMRTISDQVYRQMEKRLQLERSRRGRL